MTTSFQKKSRVKMVQIPGTKPSLYNNQLLISTGIPSLDQILGGGLAVGTVLLIEEDTYGNYSRCMLKYFCAEAVMTGHSLLLVSNDTDPDGLLKELPGPIVDDPREEAKQDEGGGDSEHMKIAWRYRHLPKFQSSPTAVKFGHYYDLTKTMEEDLVKTVQVSCFTTSCSNDANTVKQNANNPNYNQLLQNIQSHIESGGFETGVVSEKRNILRIAIHSLGSPLWGENGGITPTDDYNPALLRFLLGLRALMRSAYAACVITIPTHLFCDEVYIHKLERFCDTVVEVDSFVGSDKEKNPVYKDYHGLFHIKQLPSLNSLTCNMPETLDLAFKLRRKKFTIEKLHLPPDLSDTVNRDQEDPVARLKPEAGCGVMAGKNKLDF